MYLYFTIEWFHAIVLYIIIYLCYYLINNLINSIFYLQALYQVLSPNFESSKNFIHTIYVYQLIVLCLRCIMMNILQLPKSLYLGSL